jgi:hypothetical protein
VYTVETEFQILREIWQAVSMVRASMSGLRPKLCETFGKGRRNISTRGLKHIFRCTGNLLISLDGFQADFSLLLGARFADPDHVAPHGANRVFIEDNFDQLAAPNVETSAQPETFFRGIEDEAGEPLWLALQIND